MKKIFFLSALLCASLMVSAHTELVDFSKISLASWGGSGDPVMELDQQNETVSITIVATPGWQWGNQAKIILENVAEAGLDLNKKYKLSFHAEASTTDCGGVTLKFFDNNKLFYTDIDYLNFSSPVDFESDWLSPELEATNGTIVFDFGWDPAQTVIISNLSFLEQGDESAIDAVVDAKKAVKVVENGQLVIIKNGVRYNAAGQEIK